MEYTYTIVRKSMDDERPDLLNEYVNKGYDKDYYIGIGTILLGRNQHKNPVYNVYYMCNRIELPYTTVTQFSFVRTSSKTYANRLREWLRFTENIKVYRIPPSLSLEDIEKEEIEQARQLDDKEVAKYRALQELSHQTVMMMFPKLRDSTYSPSEEVSKNAVLMSSLFC